MDYMWKREDFSKNSKIKDSLLEKLLTEQENKSEDELNKEETGEKLEK